MEALAQIKFKRIPANLTQAETLEKIQKIINANLGVLSYNIVTHPDDAAPALVEFLPPGINYKKTKLVLLYISHKKQSDQLKQIKQFINNIQSDQLSPQQLKVFKRHLLFYIYKNTLKLSNREAARISKTSVSAHRYGARMIAQDLEINDPLRAPIIARILKKLKNLEL